jgi:hypothetical protein
MLVQHKITGLSDYGEDFREAGDIRTHFFRIWGDSYDYETNPGGMVNLGTEENYTMLEDVAAYLNLNVSSS